MPRIEFSRGENLAASKLNGLSSLVDENQINGAVRKTSKGALIRQGDNRNYIEDLKPFAVERWNTDSIIVRGGFLQHDSGGDTLQTPLVCDGGNSGDPTDYITLTPTLAASTAYVVYIDLVDTYGVFTVVAGVATAASVVGAASTSGRQILASFTSTPESNVPDLSPRDTWLYGAGSDTSEQYTVSEGSDSGYVNINPGMWVRDGNWNATRRARDYDYDTLTMAGVASNYTGKLYAYVILQNGTGHNANGWNPSSLSFDNDAPSGSYDTWVPSVDSEFEQGLEIVFGTVKLIRTALHDRDGWDPHEQIKLIAEIDYDTGEIIGIEQQHTGAIQDTDPVWAGMGGSSSDDAHFRPYIQYGSTSSITLHVNSGTWYSPRGTGSVAVASDSWTDALLLEERLYLTALPLEAAAATTSPDPALVPSNVRYEWDDGTLYDADTWIANNTLGQLLVANVFDKGTFANAVPVVNAAFYPSIQRAIDGVYFERPDSKASGLTQVDTATPRGYSLGYVADTVSADHEGELEQYRFSDTGYTEAPSDFADFGTDYAIEVRKVVAGVATQVYADISALTFPFGPVTPDDMDPDESPPSGSGWPDWIDAQLHDHEDHTFQSDDHTGKAGETAPGELDGNDRYIRHNGTAARNNMSGVIGDNALIPQTSIAPNLRILYDDDGTTISLDWVSRHLVGSNGNTSANWESKILYDDGGTSALSWQQRQLDDAMGAAVANWDDEGFKLSDADHVYWHNGNEGATESESGISGGIIYNTDALEARMADIAEMYT